MDIMCSINAWGYDILLFATSFQKSSKGWPQQPPTEKISDISEKLDFDDSFHERGQVLLILVPGMIQPSGPGSFLMKKKGFWGCRGHWGCRGRWGHWGCRGSKAYKITNEDFRVIQVVELSFIFCFGTIFVLVESWSIMLNFSTFSVRGCWGQPMLLFWKLATNIKMS